MSLSLGSSNHHAHLSSSAAEEIQGAVNILAGRQVFPSAGSSCTRPGIRVKSASESQHLLVISKSLSNSKEDFSPCAFGQFGEYIPHTHTYMCVYVIMLTCEQSIFTLEHRLCLFYESFLCSL
ncbi:unnamed protein product [Trichobilharzia regenti]|nr:unnamed protein product [Trichobilharzia regenti]